jgi:hypothetical protein
MPTLPSLELRKAEISKLANSRKFGPKLVLVSLIHKEKKVPLRHTKGEKEKPAEF